MDRLDEVLENIDPGAVMVARPVLDRLLLVQWDQPPLVGQAPKRSFLVMDRNILVNRVDSTELLIPSDRNLPGEVLVLERPTEEEMALLRRDDPFHTAIRAPKNDRLDTFDSDAHEIRRRQRLVLLELWKRLFLAMVDRSLGDGNPLEESLSAMFPPGSVGFDEISRVLLRERCVLPDSNRRDVFREFALVYLGLRQFSPQAIRYWFPIIDGANQAAIDKALHGLVPVQDLFHKSRLADWLDPIAEEDDIHSEANQYYIRLQRIADQALEKGSLVDAAIERVRASRVAPAHRSEPARAMARQHLRVLVSDIQHRLGLGEDGIDEATAVLDSLLEKADQGYRNREEKLLRELENIRRDVISPPQSLDLLGWFLSGGISRLRRPMARVDIIRATRFLRQAQQHLTFTRIDNAARQRVDALLRKARAFNENQAREDIGPMLSEALQDAGFGQESRLGKLALGQVVENLVDRILEQGFLTFQNLRDTLAISPVKMPDLSEFSEWVRGDSLLLLDRRLANLLEGIYQPSELYGATLERTTAAFFGTFWGRFLSLYILFPYLSAFILVEFVYHLLKTIESQGIGWPIEERGLGVLFLNSLAIGSFILLLTAQPRARQLCFFWLGLLFDALWWLLWDLPRRLSASDLVRSIVLEPLSWLLRYGIKPLLACLVLRAIESSWFQEWAGWFLWFLVFNLALNSRPGMLASALAWRSLRGFLSALGNGVIGGVVLIWQGILKRMMVGIDSLVMTVEELIAVRQGDEKFWIAVQALLQALWFPIGYAVRFGFMVVIEPFLNPVKLPIAFVAMKIFYPVIGPPLHLLLDESLNFLVVEALVWILDFIIPGAFGFFFWEFRENWRLYEANRPEAMPPALFGPHSESMGDLLEPGFHAGTLPALYRRLRRAHTLRAGSANLREERACLRELEEVHESILRLARRQFLQILGLCVAWRKLMEETVKHPGIEDHGTGIEVGKVDTATNRIAFVFHLHHHRLNPEGEALSMEISFMEGRLFARLGRVEWLERIGGEARRSFLAALAWFYAQMGIDVSWEHLEAGLPSGFASATPRRRWIDLHPDSGLNPKEARLRFDWTGELLKPVGHDSRIPGPIPSGRMFSGKLNPPWRDFVSWFEGEATQPSREPLKVGEIELALLPSKPSPLRIHSGSGDVLAAG